MKVKKFYPSLITMGISLLIEIMGAVTPSSTVGQTNFPSSSRTFLEQQKLEEADLLVKYATQQATKLKEQGQYSEAISLLEQALAIQKTFYYSDPTTSFNIIAKFYQSRESYQKAESLYLQLLVNLSQLAIEALEQINQGAAQAETRLQTEFDQLNNLLGNEQQLKQLDQRIQQLDQAIASGQVQGQQLTAEQRQQLQEQKQRFENLRSLRDKPEEIEKRLSQLQTQLHNQKLEREKKVKNLIVNHIANTINNLASMYQIQGKESEAKLLRQQASAILEVNNPNLANSFNNLAEFYKSQGRDEEAERLYTQAQSWI